ncbi:FUSC family protein [Streptomyces sp. NPDC060209]|uniref:FUSC family protein n=1 Tax=Streptomyces sp. NPDC060209 TaxID=3347073 RepID=UPI003666DD99
MQVNRSPAATILGRLGTDAAVRPLTPDTPLLLGRPSWRFLIGHAVEWFTSWRMALAAGIAGTVSQLLGTGSRLRVAPHTGRRNPAGCRRRPGGLRPPPVGVVVPVVVVLIWMVGQYFALAMNYAFALLFVTPMALLAVEASGTGGTVASLTFDRFTDTLIGAVTALP